MAGASGVIGRALLPLLLAEGHQVLGLTRSPDKVQALQALGADAAVCDVYDAARLTAVVRAYQPDVIVDQLTDLADDPAHIDAAANARIRTEGTANLLAAADDVRVVAQSVAWPLDGAGGEAVAWHESAVVAAGGTVVRYGQLYGPGTYYPEELPEPPRISVADAARRTVPLLDAPSGIVELAD